MNYTTSSDEFEDLSPAAISAGVSILARRHADGHPESVGKMLRAYPDHLLARIERNVNYLFHAVEDEVRERKNGHRT